ncbi:hypothetical protein GT028_16390 [Streptomyces sp. SID2999]|uniref:hypothetical protein n=1 Tax=Streptomyces sp. SID2999 TaxID=2690258 RepID=UPI001369CDB5|nr:hypothetical protein [Streptomyces sp. SID2999]MYZ08936.1 hypothetical protein [Streptomyces sp. SID2999]
MSPVYCELLAGVVALGGVFTGAGRMRALFTVTALGAGFQVPLAHERGGGGDVVVDGPGDRGAVRGDVGLLPAAHRGGGS